MMSTVTAKVHLRKKAPYATGTDYECVQLEFGPDYADGRNKAWAVATPALSLTMSVKPDVAELFNLGDAFTLVFEPEPTPAT